MIARIFTAIFYASVFFLLGVWSAGRIPSLKSAVEHGASVVGTSIRSIGGQGTENHIDSADGGIAVARAAFARGDLTAAIAAYAEVINDHPGNIDALGELGNVYFNAGRIKDAASTFHEAAVLIAASGDIGRARLLEPTIRKGDPALADDLLAKLAQPAPRQ